jgi:peptidoglycan/LPS O-acetylase OafA/YrhL
VLVGQADILAFLKARIARIWPAHLAAIALLAILTMHLNVGRDSMSTALFAAVANLFLFQSLIPIRKVFFAFNPVAWSISTEMFFYFAFPLLMAKSFFDWRFKLGLLAAVVILHLWFVAAWEIPYDSMTLKSASVDGLIYINPAVRVFEFFSGILAYWCFMRVRLYVNYSALVFTLLEVGGVALTLAVMYFTLHLPTFFTAQDNHFIQILAFYLHKSGSFWMFALLIMVFAFGKGSLTKVLSLKPMILLGEISFALYLVHRTVLEWYQMNAVYFEHLPKWSIVIGYWLLAMWMAYLLHKIVENPCRKLLIALPKLTVAEVLKTLFTGRQGVYVLFMTAILAAMLNIHFFVNH